MNCEQVTDRFLESLTGELEASASAAMETHLTGCAACRTACDNLRALWRDLEALPQESPSEALRPRFYAMLHAEQAKRQRRSLGELANSWLSAWWPRQPVAQFSLALGALAVGLTFGPHLRRTPSELVQLRNEVQATRRLATLSMLQQQSPSERLQGVSFSSQLQEPDADVLQALLQSLETDPNVNVRLAAVDALGEFLDLPVVQKGLADAFAHQTSPLVQIALIDQLARQNDPAVAAMLRGVAQDSTVNKSVRQRAQWGSQQRPL